MDPYEIGKLVNPALLSDTFYIVNSPQPTGHQLIKGHFSSQNLLCKYKIVHILKYLNANLAHFKRITKSQSMKS